MLRRKRKKRRGGRGREGRTEMKEGEREITETNG